MRRADPAPAGLDPGFVAELSERLFTLYLGGRWIAPMGERLRPVPGFPGARLACAGPGDLRRALALLGGAEGAGMAAGYAGAAGLLRRLRAREGFGDPVAPPEAFALPGDGPLVLLSAAEVPLARIAGLLIAGAGRGVLWKPAPGAAASAHVLIRALAPGPGVALLHGDHATGALLAESVQTGQGAVIWASDAAPPLPVSLCVPATDPRRR